MQIEKIFYFHNLHIIPKYNISFWEKYGKYKLYVHTILYSLTFAAGPIIFGTTQPTEEGYQWILISLIKTFKPIHSVLLVLDCARYHSHKNKTIVATFCPSSPHTCFVSFVFFIIALNSSDSYALSIRCTLPTTCANFYHIRLY